MRRRWRWPILETLRGVDEEGWMAIGSAWFAGGFGVAMGDAIGDENE